MYIPQKRAINSENRILIVVFSVIVFILAAAVLGFCLARYLRQRYSEPKYIPGKRLKRKWQQWCPGKASYGQVPNQTVPNPDHDTSYHGAGAGAATPEMTTTEGVRRETSVRSTITLPSYSANPQPTEQIISREGEREGMDMVVEYPETAEEQESRREEQMDALYQLRLQRRQDLADREANRRERREARARGDMARLGQLAAESRARSHRRHGASNSSSSLNASTIIAEHQSRERERRISSVSYADLGHVRHDGSRLRADSHESDHHPLLQNAAVNASSPSLADPMTLASRVQSFASSIMTAETAGTEAEPLVLGPTSTRGSNGPTSQPEEGDLGSLNIPPPPDYEQLDWGDAPAYESPLLDRGEHSQLPAINVDVASPVSPVTPFESQSQLENGPATPTVPSRTPSAVSAISTSPPAGHAPVRS
ncbi:hypothetical protein N7512_000463 [Penicillium capsulatum]|nr:hypothetical protein N7512_000463 [Penicillium capsulatum]